jgi:hypothetical protein
LVVAVLEHQMAKDQMVLLPFSALLLLLLAELMLTVEVAEGKAPLAKMAVQVEEEEHLVLVVLVD